MVVLQDAVFVKLELATGVVFEELGLEEFLLDEQFTECTCLALRTWVLLHEEEDDRLPDVLLTLLVLSTGLREDVPVFRPKFNNISIAIIEKSTNANIVSVFGSKVSHQLCLLQLCYDPLTVGISLGSQLVHIADGILYKTKVISIRIIHI